MHADLLALAKTELLPTESIFSGYEMTLFNLSNLSTWALRNHKENEESPVTAYPVEPDHTQSSGSYAGQGGNSTMQHLVRNRQHRNSSDSDFWGNSALYAPAEPASSNASSSSATLIQPNAYGDFPSSDSRPLTPRKEFNFSLPRRTSIPLSLADNSSGNTSPVTFSASTNSFQPPPRKSSLPNLQRHALGNMAAASISTPMFRRQHPLQQSSLRLADRISTEEADGTDHPMPALSSVEESTMNQMIHGLLSAVISPGIVKGINFSQQALKTPDELKESISTNLYVQEALRDAGRGIQAALQRMGGISEDKLSVLSSFQDHPHLSANLKRFLTELRDIKSIELHTKEGKSFPLEKFKTTEMLDLTKESCLDLHMAYVKIHGLAHHQFWISEALDRLDSAIRATMPQATPGTQQKSLKSNAKLDSDLKALENFLGVSSIKIAFRNANQRWEKVAKELNIPVADLKFYLSKNDPVEQILSRPDIIQSSRNKAAKFQSLAGQITLKIFDASEGFYSEIYLPKKEMDLMQRKIHGAQDGFDQFVEKLPRLLEMMAQPEFIDDLLNFSKLTKKEQQGKLNAHQFGRVAIANLGIFTNAKREHLDKNPVSEHPDFLRIADNVNTFSNYPILMNADYETITVPLGNVAQNLSKYMPYVSETGKQEFAAKLKELTTLQQQIQDFAHRVNEGSLVNA